MRDRLKTLLTVLVLLGVGALLGSFWLEWRHGRLGDGDGDGRAGMPSNPGQPVRVEVLNGAGDPGAAERVASRLRESGFDVVYFGNATHFGHAVSQAVNRSGRDGAARSVAGALGIDSVGTRVDRDLYLDVTVILGADWRTVLETAEGAAAESSR